MTLEQQIYNGLLADTGVTAFIGTRLFLIQLPQNPTYPCASYQRISTNPLYTQENADQGTVGWARFQISGFFEGAQSGLQCEEFAKAVTAALQTFNAGQPPASPPVLGTPPNYVMGRSMRVQPQTQPPIYMCVIDAKLWYNDSN